MIGRWAGAAMKAFDMGGSFAGRAGKTMLKNPRLAMAGVGAATGGMLGGWEGAAGGAAMGGMGWRRVAKFSQKSGVNAAGALGMGAGGKRFMMQAGGLAGPGMAMGAIGGIGGAAIGAGMSAIGSGMSSFNKPYSSYGQSFGSMGGGSPYGSTFSGMGWR